MSAAVVHQGPPLPPLRADDIDIHAARALWVAVLVETYRAGLRWGRIRRSTYEDRDAHDWFGSRDMRMVCDMIGIDPDAVEARFRDAHARGEVATRSTMKRGYAPPLPRMQAEGVA